MRPCHLDVVPVCEHSAGLLLLARAAVHCHEAGAGCLDHACVLQRALQLWIYSDLDTTSARVSRTVSPS